MRHVTRKHAHTNVHTHSDLMPGKLVSLDENRLLCKLPRENFCCSSVKLERPGQLPIE